MRPVSRRLCLAAAMLLGLLLAGCSRPLTEAERGFAEGLFGPTLDVERVRVTRGLGLAPLPEPGPARARVVALKDEPCRREPQPGSWGPPPAFALWNRMHLSRERYTPEMLPGWPDYARLPHVFYLVHELVHVWQWQNRAVTGYAPQRAFGEGLRVSDPYYYEVTAARPFHAYGYEQQASIVEDWLCHRLFDPDNPRRAMLEAILGPVFPLDLPGR